MIASMQPATVAAAVAPDHAGSPDGLPSKTIAEYRDLYRIHFGPTVIDDRTGALTVTGGQLRAVMMAPEQGIAVQRALCAEYPRAAPVYSIRNLVWSFIIEAPKTDDDEARRSLDLFSRHITIVPRGGTIALPSPGNPQRRWVHGPMDTTSPSFMSLVDAVIAAIPRPRR